MIKTNAKRNMLGFWVISSINSTHQQMQSMGQKSSFISSYFLSCRVDCDAEKVTVFIKQHCPEALLMTDIGSSLTYTLPTSELPKFDQLFSALNENLSDLGISGFGVSDSTLDEVWKHY